MVLMAVLQACAPAATPGQAGDASPQTGQQGARAATSRTLVMVARAQPEGVATRSPRAVSGRTIDTTVRLWNAGLALNDNKEVASPYLAEALPLLGTDDWRVLSDGRMETTYRLKPGLTWHDGAPLTASDFAFAYTVYKTPALGIADVPPFQQLDDVTAPDARTVVFHWVHPYAGAGSLIADQTTGFQALPKHILERPFATAASNPDGFVAQPFWSSEYVGLGPFKLTSFEPGSSVEGVAFDQHALGRAKIDRIRVLFMSDANTVLANLLSGEAHIAIDDSIRFQQAIVLQREWEPRKTGSVLLSPAQFRYHSFQLRPDISVPKTLADLRVRQAVTQAIDRKALGDALLEGQGIVADVMIVPQVDYYAEAEGVVTRYPYDVRRAEELLTSVGYAKGSDGIYAHPTEGRFPLEVRVLGGAANEQEAAIIADYLRRFGIDSSIYVVSQAESQDGQIRATFPGISASSVIYGSQVPLDRLRSASIATPENRWRGSNFGAWLNADFERLATAYESSLVPDERRGVAVQIMKVISEQVPTIPLFYNFMVTPHVADLQGPTTAVSASVAGWNVHEWRWTQ